jgi:uncharacterized RDD family membrane protein YckC
MKTCPKCGKQFPDGVKLCPFDRIALPAGDGAAPAAPAPRGGPTAQADSGDHAPTPGGATRPAVARVAASAPPAPLNKRVCALLVDGLIFSIPIYALQFIHPLIAGLASLGLSPIFYLLRDVYQGTSPGKIFVGLAVTDDNGDTPGIWALILRNVIIAIPIISLFTVIIEYIVLRMSAEGRRLGDRMAGTIVVDRHPERNDSTYLLIGIAIIILQVGINRLMSGGS